MTIDVAAVRADTPGVDRVVHFNNAGASLRPRPVDQAVAAHLRREQEIGGYEAAAEAAEEVENTYRALAELINASPEEVAYLENATRAWDMVFYSLPFTPGDRVLVGRAEYASNYLAYLQAVRRHGVEVVVVPDDEHGQISVEALDSLIDERTRLISLVHVPSGGGLVNPAAEVGRVARARGVPYLLDACQSVGQMPVDVAAIGCDFLSSTGRKFLRGPRATGFLFVRRFWIERLEPAMIDLHAATWTTPDGYELRRDARRFETWESHVAGRIGLGVAADYARRLGLEAIWERVHGLAARLRAGLEAIPGITVTDTGRVRSGIVTFIHPRLSPHQVKARLANQDPRINVEISTASSSLIDFSDRGLAAVVRASIHYYNTDDEVNRFCEVLAGW